MLHSLIVFCISLYYVQAIECFHKNGHERNLTIPATNLDKSQENFQQSCNVNKEFDELMAFYEMPQTTQLNVCISNDKYEAFIVCDFDYCNSECRVTLPDLLTTSPILTTETTTKDASTPVTTEELTPPPTTTLPDTVATTLSATTTTITSINVPSTPLITILTTTPTEVTSSSTLLDSTVSTTDSTLTTTTFSELPTSITTTQSMLPTTTTQIITTDDASASESSTVKSTSKIASTTPILPVFSEDRFPPPSKAIFRKFENNAQTCNCDCKHNNEKHVISATFYTIAAASDVLPSFLLISFTGVLSVFLF